jgi:hypothetical protein
LDIKWSLAYEEAHHGDTHKEGLHGFTSLGEIIVLDGGSDKLGLSLGILKVSEVYKASSRYLQ